MFIILTEYEIWVRIFLDYTKTQLYPFFEARKLDPRPSGIRFYLRADKVRHLVIIAGGGGGWRIVKHKVEGRVKVEDFKKKILLLYLLRE